MEKKEKLNWRPLRVKGDDVIVTSYAGWRKLKCLDNDGKYNERQNEAHLTTDLSGVQNVHVRNHKGLLLYWPVYYNFDDIPEYPPCIDCENVPCFSHYSAEYTVTVLPNHAWRFEPLMTKTVIEWFERMKDNMKNINWI